MKVLLAILIPAACTSFSTIIVSAPTHRPHFLSSSSSSSSSFLHSHKLDIEKNEAGPFLSFTMGSSDDKKYINLFGAYTGFITIITALPYLAGLFISDLLTTTVLRDTMVPFYDPAMSTFDTVGKVWCKLWLTLNFLLPEVVDPHNVQELIAQKAASGKDTDSCLFVANHSSWLDIVLLCKVLPLNFKFIAKRELTSAPIIGYQLTGGKHILIDREDRRSQLKTFKEGISWLKSGVSLMAFPEGQRSVDGRLLPFKAGAMAMAIKTKVPIIPITLCNAHAVMPADCLFPLQPGIGKLKIVFHEPISCEGGEVDKELSARVRERIVSGLSDEQLPNVEGEDNSNNSGEVGR